MRYILAICGSLVVFAAVAQGQKPPLLPEKDVVGLATELSGETAKRNLEGIARFHRQRGSRGLHEAAELVAERLRAYGLSDVAILQFPGMGRFFMAPSARGRRGMRSLGRSTKLNGALCKIAMVGPESRRIRLRERSRASPQANAQRKC